MNTETSTDNKDSYKAGQIRAVVGRVSTMRPYGAYGVENPPCEGVTWEIVRAVGLRREVKEPYRGESAWVYEGSLADFISEHGQCVVTPPDARFDMWCIEIYDEYRVGKH